MAMPTLSDCANFTAQLATLMNYLVMTAIAKNQLLPQGALLLPSLLNRLKPAFNCIVLYGVNFFYDLNIRAFFSDREQETQAGVREIGRIIVKVWQVESHSAIKFVFQILRTFSILSETSCSQLGKARSLPESTEVLLSSHCRWMLNRKCTRNVSLDCSAER